jgi:hypothetical protein
MKERGLVVVEVSPGQVSLSLVRDGRVGDARLVSVATRGSVGSENETVVSNAVALGEALAKLVSEAGAYGAVARVAFASKAAGAGVYSCPKKAGRTAALRAASLALGDAASLDLSENPHAMCVVSTDHTEEDAMTHTIGVCSSDAELTAILRLVEAGGLVFGGATPMEGVNMVSAVRAALESVGGGTRVVLHLGEYNATIVGVAGGRLRFVRQASIGLDSLVEALAREPIRDVQGSTHKIDRDAARQIILRHGIPIQGQAIEIRPDVMSTAVLPVLQSTLQRLVVEAKQSSRFGLSEEQRAQVALTLGGVGASITGLAGVVSELTGLKLAAGEGSAQDRTAGRSEDYQAWSKTPELRLYPRARRQALAIDVVRRGLMVGSAVALAVMAMSWGKTRLDLHRVGAEILSLNAPHQAGGQAESIAERVRVADVFLETTREALQKSMPARVRAEGVLLALAEAAPAGLRLTSIDLEGGESCGTVRLEGKVLASAGRGATDVIGAFIDGIAESPAVKSCKIVSTRRGSGIDAGTLFFEMSIDPVHLPGASLATFDWSKEDTR